MLKNEAVDQVIEALAKNIVKELEEKDVSKTAIQEANTMGKVNALANLVSARAK